MTVTVAVRPGSVDPDGQLLPLVSELTVLVRARSLVAGLSMVME